MLCAAGLALLPSAALPCELALLLAVDVSGSVDGAEYRLQMEGLGAALRDDQIAEALVAAEAAVAVVQWTGMSRQDLSIDWTRTRSFEEVERLSAQVAETQRRWRNFATAVGAALEFSLDVIERAPECRRRVIDVSGDGFSNEGIEPDSQRARLDALGVTVNGLAIEGAEIDLTAYYWENIIHGPGAFVVTAEGFEDYPYKIRRKLLKEVVEQVSGLPPGVSEGPRDHSAQFRDHK